MSLSGQETGEKGNRREITDTLEGHSPKGPRIPLYNPPRPHLLKTHRASDLYNTRGEVTDTQTSGGSLCPKQHFMPKQPTCLYLIPQ